MFSEQAWRAIGEGLRLSRRELQILQGLFDSRVELAIASDLGISPHTVHTHVERLHRKLGVNSRGQMFTRVMAEFLAQTCAPASPLPALCGRRSAGLCPLSAPTGRRRGVG